MDGEGFADKCSGICTATHNVERGDQRYIEVTAYPNHSGTYRLEGRVEFVYDGKQRPNQVTQDVRITVTGGDRTYPLPTSPPQPPTAPPAVQPTAGPTAAPPTPAVIVVTQPPPNPPPICGAPPPDASSVVDPSLLLAGLLIPAGILARLGINRRRKHHRSGDNGAGNAG